MKKLALVLGGGAAKGYSHIGVLKVLENHGIKPDLIVGTSMGALVGGMYCAGKNIEELQHLAYKFNSIGHFSLFSTLFKGSLLSPKKVTRLLKKELGDFKQENCKIPFIAIATELSTGKEVRLKKGILRRNIMAGISIPGVFPNVKIGNSSYCDGGLVNNLAEDVARELMPDAVIVSVDVLGDYSKQYEACKIKAVETFLNASTLMTTNAVKSKGQFADLRITILQPEVGQMGFNKSVAKLAITNGENFTIRHISTIKKMLGAEDE